MLEQELTESESTKLELIKILNKEGFSYQADCLSKGKTALSFFYHHPINIVALNALADASKKGLVLTKLSLEDNKIDIKEIHKFLENIIKNPYLLEFNLKGLKIGNYGVKIIANNIEENSSVRVLNLCNNDITDNLNDTLKDDLANIIKSSNLIKFDLSYNKINNIGAQALADALKYNEHLLEFNIWNNKIGNDEVNAFAEALEHNKHLLQFIFYLNKNISKANSDRIKDSLKRNNELKAQKITESSSSTDNTNNLKEHKETDVVKSYSSYKNNVLKRKFQKEEETQYEANKKPHFDDIISSSQHDESVTIIGNSLENSEHTD